MCLRERKKRELRSGLRFAGSLGAGSCLFGLGSAQGGRVPMAPDEAGLSLANILSSDSGDRLYWERRARVSASHKSCINPAREDVLGGSSLRQ